MDDNGILISYDTIIDEVKTSKNAWEKIYNYRLDELKKNKEDFEKNKLEDHIKYICNLYKFDSNTLYLEIGCGPAYIGEYIMKNYDSYFIGVDFNYNMLLTLKEYFDQNNYKKYLLIHGDINNMPINDNSIDFIYGAGVIEHFPDTNHIVKESYRILKMDGVSFNTVPSFNLWWLLKISHNIPSLPLLKKIFEYIHIRILKNKILEKNYGYELSFTKNTLIKLHRENGFKNIEVGPFAFHPSSNKLKNTFLRELYYKIQQNSSTSALYFISGSK